MFIHWIVTDVPGGSLAAGSAAEIPLFLDYLGGYVFLLFEQPEGFDSASLASSVVGRGGKKVCFGAKSAGLGKVVAATWFLSEWDESIDAVHEAMGWLPPAPYRSPAQQTANPERSFKIVYEAYLFVDS